MIFAIMFSAARPVCRRMTLSKPVTVCSLMILRAAQFQMAKLSRTQTLRTTSFSMLKHERYVVQSAREHSAEARWRRIAIVVHDKRTQGREGSKTRRLAPCVVNNVIVGILPVHHPVGMLFVRSHEWLDIGPVPTNQSAPGASAALPPAKYLAPAAKLVAAATKFVSPGRPPVVRPRGCRALPHQVRHPLDRKRQP